MLFRINYFKILVLLFPILFFIVACSTIGTTKPNAPNAGPFPNEFKKIEERNPLLAKELGKLPELQDGISESDAQAIERLCTFYDENPLAFDNAFYKMYKVGIPEVRRYCSPLQALFWLYVDLKDNDAMDIVQEYDLNKLLDISWYSHNQSYKLKGKWLQAEAGKLYESCHDEDIKKQIDKYSREHPQLGHGLAVQYTFQQYRQHPEKFNYCFDESKFEPTKTKNHNRWNDFYEVADRLNDPILLDHYINNNISYKYDHLNGKCQHPKVTFNKKSGCCVCAAKFGAYCLDRAGYETSIRHLKRDYMNQHGVLVLKKEEKYFIVVNFGGNNTISGPYQNVSEVDKRIMGNDVLEKTYFPKY